MTGRNGGPLTLAVILMNPPLTSGKATIGRLRKVGQIFGVDEVHVANLFPIPSRSTDVIEEIGVDEADWVRARSDIAQTLLGASHVLLAYGIRAPRLGAGLHQSSQVQWLLSSLQSAPSRIWMVGESPRHPSRWQRYTSRAFPGQPFDQALRAALIEYGFAELPKTNLLRTENSQSPFGCGTPKPVVVLYPQSGER